MAQFIHLLSRPAAPDAWALVTQGNFAKDQSGVDLVSIMDIFPIPAFPKAASAITGPFPNQKLEGHARFP